MMKFYRSVAGTLLLAASLMACDDSTVNLAEGGMTGTGISVGAITGFGSIWVNGVRYDVSTATFSRDGASVSGQSDYRIGEVVTIEGSVNPDGASGLASSVEFDDLLEGTVSQVSTDGTTLQVLGQMVSAGARTALHGFAALTDLQAGNVVEVSGYRQGQVIRATSITLKQRSFAANQSVLEMKGTVRHVDLNAQTFQLGQWIVDYSGARLALPDSAPRNGQYVEVKSRQAVQGNRLLATEVELEDEYPVFGVGQEVELEGVVTAFTSSVQFSVNGQAVMTGANTRFEHGIAADIKLGSLLEVEGHINIAGILVATEISLQQSDAVASRELEGRILALDQVNRTIMLGTATIVVDNSTRLTDEVNDRYISLSFADLRINDFIEVYGSRLNDGRILALAIERENGDD